MRLLALSLANLVCVAENEHERSLKKRECRTEVANYFAKTPAKVVRRPSSSSPSFFEICLHRIPRRRLQIIAPERFQREDFAFKN